MVEAVINHIINKTDDPKLIEGFVIQAGDSLKHFRYFESRSFDVIRKHLVTYLLYIPEQENAIGYGHLEFEDNRLWLGIVVSSIHKGKGFGNLMLGKLIESAREQKCEEIFLTVDIDNKPAISLYGKFGFILIEKKNELVQLMRLSLHE
jgi:ribosomal protein S18 acetylase RimI-like enzyme